MKGVYAVLEFLKEIFTLLFIIFCIEVVFELVAWGLLG